MPSGNGQCGAGILSSRILYFRFPWNAWSDGKIRGWSTVMLFGLDFVGNLQVILNKVQRDLPLDPCLGYNFRLSSRTSIGFP